MIATSISEMAGGDVELSITVDTVRTARIEHPHPWANLEDGLDTHCFASSSSFCVIP